MARTKIRVGWHRYVNTISVSVVVISLVILAPLYWMVATSFKTPSGVNNSHQYLPQGSFANYKYTFNTQHFGGNIVNSLVVSVVSTLLVLFLGTMAGYALGRTPMKGKFTLLVILLIISVFPVVAVISPLYKLFHDLGWLNTYQALILPYTAFNLPFAIWILRNYMLGIPKEMEETARIDGSSNMRTLWTIIVPQAKPGLFTAGIFCFTACWTEFLMALVLDNQKKTVPVAIGNFAGQFTVPYGAIFAASAVVSVPIAVLVIVFRKSVVSGLTAGAVKG